MMENEGRELLFIFDFELVPEEGASLVLVVLVFRDYHGVIALKYCIKVLEYFVFAKDAIRISKPFLINFISSL